MNYSNVASKMSENNYLARFEVFPTSLIWKVDGKVFVKLDKEHLLEINQQLQQQGTTLGDVSLPINKVKKDKSIIRVRPEKDLISTGNPPKSKKQSLESQMLEEIFGCNELPESLRSQDARPRPVRPGKDLLASQNPVKPKKRTLESEMMEENFGCDELSKSLRSQDARPRPVRPGKDLLATQNPAKPKKRTLESEMMEENFGRDELPARLRPQNARPRKRRQSSIVSKYVHHRCGNCCSCREAIMQAEVLEEIREKYTPEDELKWTSLMNSKNCGVESSSTDSKENMPPYWETATDNWLSPNLSPIPK